MPLFPSAVKLTTPSSYLVQRELGAPRPVFIVSYLMNFIPERIYPANQMVRVLIVKHADAETLLDRIFRIFHHQVGWPLTRKKGQAFPTLEPVLCPGEPGVQDEEYLPVLLLFISTLAIELSWAISHE